MEEEDRICMQFPAGKKDRKRKPAMQYYLAALLEALDGCHRPLTLCVMQ